MDGYAGYDGLPNITLVGCWVGARRKFDEALKAFPLSVCAAEPVAQERLVFYNRLLAIERDSSEATPAERSTTEWRSTASRPCWRS